MFKLQRQYLGTAFFLYICGSSCLFSPENAKLFVLMLGKETLVKSGVLLFYQK